MLSMYHHSNPVPQRSHKKSSKGCKACKARKVKCDEKKPVCGKCAVHFSNITSCDYEPTPRRTRKVLAKIQPIVEPPQQSRKSESESSSPDSSATSCQAVESIQASSSDSGENGVVSIRSKGLQHAASSSTCCKCPCHNPEYSDMLSDAIFGICRICGNFPRSDSRIDECNPVMPKEALLAGKIDPFAILPVKSSPSVHALMHHWVKTLAMFPTTINSEYCTNSVWLTAAIANSALFNVTLYVSSLHIAGLHSYRETSESLFYKVQTVNCLNECLRDSKTAVTDETIAAVLLLLFVVCIIGDKYEVDAHVRGLKRMIELRGGIHSFAIDGVFLHMLCTTNHLTAVLDESPSLHPPFNPAAKYLADVSSTRSSRSSSPSSSSSSSTPPSQNKQHLHTSPVWKPFALKMGFHNTVVDIFHEMGYLFSVVDAFTTRLMPYFRGEFDGLVKGIEEGIY